MILPDPNRKLIQVSVFWKNKQPGGFGFSFGPPLMSPVDLANMFEVNVLKQYMKDSDDNMGNGVIKHYMDQLDAIGQAVHEGKRPDFRTCILAAFNIMWLSERGFMANDEFNGVQFVVEQVA